MRRDAFLTGVLRSVRGSLGRFLAIVGIVALGCGFFAGLRMSGADMRTAGDLWYDGCALWDLRLVSTMGFTDADVDRVASIEGVERVMPARTFDAMASLGSSQSAVRVSTMDATAAEGSTQADDFTVGSGDDSYLNRLMLREGRWPEAADECVISADAPDSAVGVGDTIELLSSTEDLDDLVVTRTLTVVGTVSSPNYPYTGSFGSTALGTGQIDQYLYVLPEAFADDVPYTELYMQAAGAVDEASESDEYFEVVDAVADLVEKDEGSLAAARLDDLRSDAQAKIDDAWADYRSERADVEAELADAKSELDEGKAELDDALAELEEGEAQYADGLASYNAGVAEYEDGLASYESGRARYQAGVDELLSGLASQGLAASTLDEAAASVSQQDSRLAATQATLEEAAAGLSKIESAEGQVASGQEAIDQATAELDAREEELARAVAAAEEAAASFDPKGMTEEELAAYQERLAAQTAELEAARQAIADGRSEVAAQQAALDAAAEELAFRRAQALAALAASGLAADDVATAKASVAAALSEVTSGRSQLETAANGISQLRSSASQLDSARAQLDTASAQLDSARSELAASRTQLDDGWAEYRDGLAEYEDGLAEYEDGVAEAEQGFADAEAELEDAQDEVDSLEAPDLYLLTRAQGEGQATYHADSERMDRIATVFPMFFFLVAALVSLTTMTRMVEDDRVEVGTYKALGYSTGRIASKYLLYAGVASTVGAVLGIAVLTQVLPVIIIRSYAIIYAVPFEALPLPVDLPVALAAGGLGIGVTLLATLAAVLSSLRSTPAELMLPRAPKPGKRILLERLGPVWSRMSFSWKVTFRNLFRYKRRFFMTVLGISGCTALLLVGFGLHDAIWDIIDNQYGPIVHYDTTIGLSDDADEGDVDELVSYLESTGEVSDIVRVSQENWQVSGPDGGDTHLAAIILPRSAEELEEAVSLRERVSGEEIEYGPDSVVVTEKLASLASVAVGDQIRVYEQDKIGNPQGEGHLLTVTGVAENYVGNQVYVGEDAWATVTDEEPVFRTILACVTEDSSVRDTLAEGLHDNPLVSTVTYSDETIENYRNMLTVVDGIVVVLIVSAGALAFIVLYNLTNINVGERVREIASLKVLGFTRKEVHAYIFREIILLAAIGDALGMALGTWLATFTITTAEVDYVMFGRTIHPASYAYSFAITMAFAVLIVLIMRRKLDSVDMVESLKSVD